MFRFNGMNVWKQKGTRTSYKSRLSPVRRSKAVSLFLTAITMAFQPLTALTNVATNSLMHEKLIKRIASGVASSKFGGEAKLHRLVQWRTPDSAKGGRAPSRHGFLGFF